tara:strand:+ start:1075 stop:1191 length:117 start_codon:yes stop_codon:yes gene_type:complete
MAFNLIGNKKLRLPKGETDEEGFQKTLIFSKGLLLQIK